MPQPPVADRSFLLSPPQLQRLWETLGEEGYTRLGPRVVEGDLVLGELPDLELLPRKWTDRQEPGAFRLAPREDGCWFNFRAGQDSLKRLFFPAEVCLWRARREGQKWRVSPPDQTIPAYAVIGVRACDLAALAVQDQVFLKGLYVDLLYQARRGKAFLIAVNCTESGGTCFCASLGTGPRAVSGFDLALTEILEGSRHYFLAETGSERGAALAAQLRLPRAGPGDLARSQEKLSASAHSQARRLHLQGLKEFLYQNYENPHWDEIAARCLACGNCALVCPTCFCHQMVDNLNVAGDLAERRRHWDACFTLDHSYMHGGSIRKSVTARYRQWLTHKLAAWQDQFGCLGCVGCGRCLTWCPVGIDLTQEITSLQTAAQRASAADPEGEEHHEKP